MATWHTEDWSSGRCPVPGGDLQCRKRSGTDSYRIRLYTSEHERETEYAEVGASGVQEVGAPLSQGHRSGAAHPPAYGLARVAGRAGRRGSPDGWLLSEVDQGDPKALRGRRVRSPLGDRRHANPGGRERALLDEEGQAELRAAVLEGAPPGGGMWSGPKVARWIAQRTGSEKVHPQRGWEYLRKARMSPQVPRPSNAKGAPASEREAFKKVLR